MHRARYRPGFGEKVKWHLAWSLSCAIQGQRKKEASVGAAIDRELGPAQDGPWG